MLLLRSTSNTMNIQLSPGNKKGDKRFLFLLLSLVLIIIAAPFLLKTAVSALLLNLVASIILVAAIYELRGKKNVLIIALTLAIISVILHGIFLRYQTSFTSTIDSLASLVFIGFISIRIFKAMMEGHTITQGTIYGAMCIYLLLGIFFGDIYAIIESLSPGSFIASGLYGLAEVAISRFNLITFSYAMLTTVGHSKIVTTNMIADSFVILEELIGVLYLAVLIARLVTGFSSMHKDKLA